MRWRDKYLINPLPPQSAKCAVKDVRRETMLQVAKQIFLDEGYEAASMSAIAARLGGSKGTLYNYFSSKGELFAAVIQDQCDRKLAMMFEGVETPDNDVPASLRILGQRFATMLLSDDTIRFGRALTAEAERFPELGKTMYEAGVLRTVQRLAAYLEEQMLRGRLRAFDPQRAAEQLFELSLAGLYRKRLWNVIDAPKPPEIAENVDAAVSTFMAAFGLNHGEASI